MEYNIIIIYTKFVKDKLLELFKLLLQKDFNTSTCKAFINRYIDVRYYNETNYTKEKDFINRLNKELVDVYESQVTEQNKENLKNIVALFAYISYLDDLFEGKEDMEILNTLANDEDIKIPKKENFKQDLRKWYFSFKKGKNKFQAALMSKEFSLSEKRVYRKTLETTVEQNVKISNLYSEVAINKAYNMGVVAEDKLFINAILTSEVLLNNAISLDFTTKYILPLESSLFNKHKKLNRFLSILDNPLCKKYISIKILASEYLQNIEFIQGKMKEGYQFAIELDTEIDESQYILFSYIYVYEDSEIFDIIINGKDKMTAKVIKI